MSSPPKNGSTTFPSFRFPSSTRPLSRSSFSITSHHHNSDILSGISNREVYQYDYDLTRAKDLIAPLGVPWHQEKGQPFGDTVEYLGFLWNIPLKSVILTASKKRKYIVRLSQFLSSFEHHRVPKKEGESVAGYLQHSTFVYPQGQSYLANLYAWLAVFPNEHAPRYMCPSVISDLKWWLQTLQEIRPPRSLLPRPPTRDYGIWVDASSDHGVGLLWNGLWAFWGLTDSWRGSPGEGRDIGWLEAVAVELAIRLIHDKGVREADILIRSDNEGVIHAFRKGRSRNHMVNTCIRRAEALSHPADLSFSLIYVPSEENLADPISRRLYHLPPTRLSSPPLLPPEISQWFRDV
jgi:hypothetical protein